MEGQGGCRFLPPFLKGGGGDFKVLPFNKKLKPLARQLRKNMTEAERALWLELRKKQLNGRIFYRQKNIGDYIVDFYCPSAKLAVELDGGQRYSVKGRAKDEIRDEYLANLGLKVFRFSDLDVLKNMEGVLAVLHENTKIPPAPLYKGGG
jgi:very-short-patch-repair endonuclease